MNIIGTAMTKRLDAGWAVGTGNGFRNSAIAITDTTYHIYAVCKAAGADPDYYAHTSVTVATVIAALQAESGGSAYLYARRIGSIVRVAGVIRPFTQNGDEFLWKVPIQDVNVSNLGTTAVLYLLTVPLGLQVRAKLSLLVLRSAAFAYLLVTSPDQTDSAAGAALHTIASTASGATGETCCDVRTNAAGQIRGRADAASTLFQAITHGYIDRRERD